MNTIPQTILLVEDNIISAIVTKSHLEHNGYDVVVSATGTEALSLIENPNFSFDLVIMDIELGNNESGFDVAKSIVGFSPIPIIFYSGHSPEVFQNRQLLDSDYVHIKKSSDIKPLLQIVNEYLIK